MTWTTRARFLWILAVAVLGVPAVGLGCELVNESFEFDAFGDFEVGDSPDTVFFAGGEAKSIGNFDLYRSGIRSWMIDAQNTGTVTFETNPGEVEFYFRDENANVQSVLTVFDEQGGVVAQVNGTEVDWQQVSVSGGVGSITLENTGAGPGYTAIDDFSCAAGVDVVEDPIPQPIAAAPIEIGVELIASGLTAPNWGTFRPSGGALAASRLVVTDQIGLAWDIDLNGGGSTLFLDVSERLVPLGIGGPGTFDERGLLGLAFHPDYAANGLLYTYTSEPVSENVDFPLPAGVEADHHAVVTEWRVNDPLDPAAVVDPTSDRVLMRIAEPQFNHDGGAVNFGPDGNLYVSLGDGGNADDEGDGHSESGNGQDPSNVLGTILRIDPLGANSANGQYSVPADNPFIGEGPPFGGADGCADGVCDEIYLWGLRNPFRFSFDIGGPRSLYVADVGQNDLEEVSIGVSGGNYGWPIKEGTFCFDGNGTDPGFVFECDPEPEGLVEPFAQYDHDEGIAIIGGFVYRGSAIPDLAGRYVFGEYAQTFNADGRLFVTRRNHGRVRELLLPGGAQLGHFVLGFGQDRSGEIYILANDVGVPSDTTGLVIKIVPAGE